MTAARAVVIAGVATLVAALFVLRCQDPPSGLPVQRGTAVAAEDEPRVASLPGAREESPSAALERTEAEHDDRVTITTVITGVPVESRLHEIRPQHPMVSPCMSGYASSHLIPSGLAAGKLLLYGRDTYARIVSLGEPPPSGEHEVELVEREVLKVTIDHFPEVVPEPMRIMLYARYGPVSADDYAVCCYLHGNRPMRVESSYVEIPLLFPAAGMLSLYAQSGDSGIMISGTEAEFSHTNPWVRLDASCFDGLEGFQDVRFELTFPSPYPSGELDLTLEDSHGMGLWHETFTRSLDEDSVTIVFGNMPNEELHPLLDVASGRPSIALPTIAATGGVRVIREVVAADSTLRVTVHPADAGNVGVLVKNAAGRMVGSSREIDATGSCEIGPLSAGSYFLQALSEVSSMCSEPVRVEEAESALALADLVLRPAGRVRAKRAVEEVTPRVDLVAGGDRYRYYLHADVGKSTTWWCPAGSYRVEAGDEVFDLQVRAGETTEVTIGGR